MAKVFTTRAWTFKPGQGERGRRALGALERIAAEIPGAVVRLYRDRRQPERYVMFAEWPDEATFHTAFGQHPEIAQAVAAIREVLDEAYPATNAIVMEEVGA